MINRCFIAVEFYYSADIILQYSSTAIISKAISEEFENVGGQGIRNEQVMKAFGERLRELRKEKGLTQERLEELSGISQVSIARIETGKLNTTISTIVALAQALKVETKELMRF